MHFARKTLILLVIAVNMSSAIGQDTYVRLQGSVFNAKDSSALVKASLFLERLPYYDKQFRASSDENGGFEMYLTDSSEYTVLIQLDGFETLNQSVSVSDQGNESMSASFYVRPIEIPVEPEEPEEQIFILENLIFSSGSDVIQKSSFAALDEFALWLKARPSYVVQLEGHTDVAGNAEANLRLSQARVESVKEYIRKKGIRKVRVLTKAFGGTQPLSMERTDLAKRANRRVEVRVIAR